jgi:hypothetical protein
LALLGAVHNATPVYGSGGFTSYSIIRLQEQLGGWVAAGIPRVKMTVGATSEDELEQIIRAGGRKGEIYGKLKALRDRYADEIRRRDPKDLPRRVSGYNLDDLLPEKGFHVARALSGTEGTCVIVLEASLHLA